jgi:hypothetical protein
MGPGICATSGGDLSSRDVREGGGPLAKSGETRDPTDRTWRNKPNPRGERKPFGGNYPSAMEYEASLRHDAAEV